jgi:hypothetical protein
VPSEADLALSEFGFANMRYLVQPSDQPMRVAVDRLMRGEGRQQVKGTDRVLPAGANFDPALSNQQPTAC